MSGVHHVVQLSLQHTLLDLQTVHLVGNLAVQQLQRTGLLLQFAEKEHRTVLWIGEDVVTVTLELPLVLVVVLR